MSDFSDPIRQRETRIQELEDTLDRTEKRLKEVREELRTLRRREELLDADAEDIRRQLTHEKQEDERQRIMSEIQERKDK